MRAHHYRLGKQHLTAGRASPTTAVGLLVHGTCPRERPPGAPRTVIACAFLHQRPARARL